MLPLGGPAVGPDAELLLELDVAVGRFEEGADDLEESAEPGVVAGGRVRATEVEHEVVGEELGEGVVVLGEDGSVMRLMVSTLGWSLLMVISLPGLRFTSTVRTPTRASGEPSIGRLRLILDGADEIS